MIHYILQTITFQLFFLLIYDLFLKKETFFNWNRFYLLITALCSIVLPFIKFESIRTIVPEQFVIRLPEVVIGGMTPIAENNLTNIQSEVMSTSSFIWSWDYLLYVGMTFASLIFIYKIIKISTLIQKNPKDCKGNLIIVHLLKSNAAFSFFNYVFLGEWIKEGERETILKHEMVHVSEKHSADLLLFELLRILFWFNPLIYMYQNRLTTLHEYIADAKAMKQCDKKEYYEKLLSQVFNTENISFTNTFFNQSLIKKRIIMLSKSKSNRIHLFKYALLIPMVFGMLMYTSSYAQEKILNEVATNQELTFDQLIDKYYKEITELVENGASMQQIQSKYDIMNMPIVKDKYIKSIVEVAKMKAYNKYSADEYIRMQKKQGIFSDRDMGMVNEVLNRYKTYEEYLAYQKTNEAKLDWESDINDGELRLVVDDLKSLTELEKAEQQIKFDLIMKDDFFHTLLITDGKGSTKVVVHSVDGKEKPNSNKNKEAEEVASYDLEVPFSVIDEVPTLEACKDLATNDEKRQCLSDYISDFVNKNFNTKLGKELGLTGKQRISVMFKIGKDGNIQNIMARAPHPGLEAEAKRVVGELPQFTPGKQKGETVVVPYSLPILFQVSE